MAREIKFRAWIPNTGWLADGFSVSMDGKYWYDDNCHEWKIEGNLILMQFTGLKDKNGKEIYEGDVVIIGDKKYPRVIEWHILGLRCKQINGDANFPIHYPFVGKEGLSTDWEVIGNIYENPELLK